MFAYMALVVHGGLRVKHITSSKDPDRMPNKGVSYLEHIGGPVTEYRLVLLVNIQYNFVI